MRMRMIYQVTNPNKTPYMVGHPEGRTEDSDNKDENEDDISSN